MRVGTLEVPKWGQISRESTTILLAIRVATCYPRSVNRNIFYIIGVIVVIVIVLKVLHVF
jgi:quinol-cytochrome oxidoreductase complex cytochrome b subunit